MASSTPEQNRGPELRRDPINNRWVILSPARAKRPSDFKFKSPQDASSNSNSNSNSSCPFCIGNEHQCAPEIFRVPTDPNWKLRVIQNLYPALSRDVEKDGNPPRETSCQSYSDRVVKGFGFHDVVIETPVHSVHLSDLDPIEVGEVLLAYKKRIHQIQECEFIKYVQVFKNHGASAGASMSHSHSQMLALPVVPPTVSARIRSTKEYFNETGKCSLCEVQPKDLLVDEAKYFVSVVPFAATFPFEIWIIPRDHSSHFHDIDREKAIDLGRLLKLILRKLAVQLNNPPFNFMIQTSPLHVTDLQLAYTHWFLQIVPQLTGAGGFELGSGCYINPVFPEDAAKVLREVNVSI